MLRLSRSACKHLGGTGRTHSTITEIRPQLPPVSSCHNMRKAPLPPCHAHVCACSINHSPLTPALHLTPCACLLSLPPGRSIIWYVALDPLKWLMMYILNEEGVRDREGWKRLVHARPKPKAGECCNIPRRANYRPNV